MINYSQLLRVRGLGKKMQLQILEESKRLEMQLDRQLLLLAGMSDCEDKDYHFELGKDIPECIREEVFALVAANYAEAGWTGFSFSAKDCSIIADVRTHP